MKKSPFDLSKLNSSLIEIYFLHVSRDPIKQLVQGRIREGVKTIGLFRNKKDNETDHDIINEYLDKNENLQGNIVVDYDIKILDASFMISLFIMRIESEPDLFDINIVIDNDKKFKAVLLNSASFEEFLKYVKNIGKILGVTRFYIGGENSLDPRQSDQWVIVDC